ARTGRTRSSAGCAGIPDQPAARPLAGPHAGTDPEAAPPAPGHPGLTQDGARWGGCSGSAGPTLADSSVRRGAEGYRRDLLYGPARQDATYYRAAADPACAVAGTAGVRSEEHTSELQSRENL